MDTNGKLYRFFWKVANWFRRLFHRPTKPKRCCCDDANLAVEESGIPGVGCRRCAVCGCRHFDVSADPGTGTVRIA